MVSEAFGSGSQIVAVNWLPPHHDMGLFGAILPPLWLGGGGVDAALRLHPEAAALVGRH